MIGRAQNGWIGRAEDSASDSSWQMLFVHPITRSPDHRIF